MLRSIGLSSSFAFWRASGPHGYQSTGLWACCSRYGLVSPARRFAIAQYLNSPVSPEGTTTLQCLLTRTSTPPLLRLPSRRGYDDRVLFCLPTSPTHDPRS